MSKVELKIPTYMLLEGASNPNRMARITIEDCDENGELDLKSDCMQLNGVTLSEKQKKEVLKRLGVTKAQGFDLNFAQRYFGRLSLIAEKVGRGQFRNVDDVDNALVRGRKDYIEPMYFGIETPSQNYLKIKNAAYDVAARRVRLEKGLGHLEKMFATGDPGYWKYSQGLRAGFQYYGMKAKLDRLVELDKKAYCDPKLKDCIPVETKDYLAKRGHLI